MVASLAGASRASSSAASTGTVRTSRNSLPSSLRSAGENASAHTRPRSCRSTPVEHQKSSSSSTGVLRHERGLVWAEDFSPAERKLDGSEFLDVRTVPVDEALELARSAPANDATIEGLLLADADGYL